MTIILYELVASPGKPYYSPNTWKTRLSLLHKGVPFKTVEHTYKTLQSLAGRMGVEKALVPTIELDDGSFISDSYKIAEYLEKAYPDAPSLFLPAAPTPISFDGPEIKSARAFAFLFNEGFGDSEPGWAPFFELVAPGLANTFPDDAPDHLRTYFTSDAKLGGKDTFAKILAMDRPTLILRAQASVLPLVSLLSSSPFLCGPKPGFIDYVAFGRFAMMRMCDAEATKRVWLEKDALRNWVARVEGCYGEDLRDALGRLEEL